MHPSEIKIGQTELSVIDIFDMVIHGHIDLESDSKSWNRDRMSKSIESVLLGLTMTPIYVDATNPEKWLVLDGTKRLNSLVRFIAGKLILNELELLNEYSYCSFSELPKNVKRRLFQSKFTIYSINQGVPPEVRLSLIRRIVPDIKAGLSLKMKESLLNLQSKKLINLFSSNSIYQEVILSTKTKKTIELELEIKFLKALYSFFKQDKFDRFYQNAKSEDIIVMTNYYAQSKSEFDFIIETWNNGLNRISNLFQNYAFKTSTKSIYINKYYFDFLIVFFGEVISDEMLFKLNQNRNSFLSEWFKLIQSDEGKKVFKSTSSNKKIQKLDLLVKTFKP